MRKSVSDQAVQPQKIEAWNFRFSKKRTIYGVTTNGADQLCSNCTADLHHCFRICRLLFFWTSGSFLIWLHSVYCSICHVAVIFHYENMSMLYTDFSYINL